MRTECVGPLLGANVTSAIFRVRMNPHKWQSSHLQLYTLLHSRKLYTLNSFAKMFTIDDNIFQSLGYSSVNPKQKVS